MNKCPICDGNGLTGRPCPKCKGVKPLRTVLLDVHDGPEGIKIYTDDDRGVIDWSNSFPAVYLEVSINGAFAKFGPFSLDAIYRQLAQQTR